MSGQTAVPDNHALMIAWKNWTSQNPDEGYANAHKWAATDDQYIEGSLWAAFTAGFTLATARAGDLHESVNPASDYERHDKLPGAGAMGAVIEYRDLIRKLV